MPKVGSNGAPTTNGAGKKPITIACCVPKQEVTYSKKLDWLKQALSKTKCDFFILPQEFVGGHYVWQLARRTGLEEPLHYLRDKVVEDYGKVAREFGVCLGIGGCLMQEGAGAMEEYLYLSSKGELLGLHAKFALPAYDDMRAGGHGRLWPETNYRRRATPVEIPELRLRVGTIFCWECHSQTLWGSYSMAGVTLITHPIKFAPRGWLKNQVLEDGKKHIVDFGNAPKSQIWIDRLLMASRHQVMCPIAVSCNSWNLGPKFMALTGHVDEIKHTTDLLDIPALGDKETIHTFEMLPEAYSALDHMHSAGAFKAHTGSVEGYSEMGEYTMHAKIRRLEAHLLGGTTHLDCTLKGMALTRQKKSSIKRAFGTGLQKVKREKK